jgi:hypothetical protein
VNQEQISFQAVGLSKSLFGLPPNGRSNVLLDIELVNQLFSSRFCFLSESFRKIEEKTENDSDDYS